MKGSVRSILFYEDKLDFRHLSLSLENYDIKINFCKSPEGFKEQTDLERYDLLVVSGIERTDYNFPLIDALYDSKNSDTPILYITDNNNFPPIDALIKQQLGVITFPFSIEEFIFRSNQILRSAETDQNIHNSLKNYKNLIDIIPVGIIQTDAHGKFLKVNPRFLSLINMNEKDLFKENFFQLCHPDDYFLERKQLDRLLKKDINCVDFEIRLINNEGITTVFSVEANILWKGKDVFEAFIFVVRKVS